MRFPDSVISSLTSLVVLVTSSSSSLATTEELASLLLCFAVVMLVAGGGGGGGGAGVVMATAFNYTDPGPGSRRGGGGGGGGPATSGASNVPGPRQLNRDTLRARLGSDFDPDRMSIDQPSTHSRAAAAAAPEFDPELAEDLTELDFSYQDERGDRRTIPTAVRSVVERWLLQRASCPVRYVWLDMGAVFWPRWIKQGYCDADVPCSWPPGMHCAPAMSDTLRLLHWYCPRSSGNGRRRVKKRRSPDDGADPSSSPSNTTTTTFSSSSADSDGVRRPRRSQGRQQQCRWKKVPFPVTSECFCSC